MSLLETEVPIRDVITTTPGKASALEHDVRAKVLDMLADRAMSVEEIQAELERRGEEKAETTVRHHVNVLKDAGLVELARLEEAGGAVRKHYRSNTRVYSYELPDDADETLAGATAFARAELARLVDGLFEEHGAAIDAVVAEMQPCEYCAIQHYEEFVVRELLTRALTQLGEDGELEAAADG